MEYPTLSTTHLLLAITLLATTCYIATAVQTRNRLRQFQGPWLASFSYIWLLRVASSGRSYKIHMATRRRHGGQGALVRIGPKTLITDDEAVLRRINEVRSGYVRSKDWYAVMRLDPTTHNMVSTPDVRVHDNLRARCIPGYHGRDVPTMEADVDEMVAHLKGLIRKRYLSCDHMEIGRQMDWGLVSQYFTVDTLTKIGFGEAFGCLEANADVGRFIQTLADFGPYFALCSDVPWIGKVVLSDFMLKLIGPKPTDKTGLGLTMALAKKIASERYEPNAKEAKDIVGSFVRHGLNREQCESEILFLLVAGSDTVANVLSNALLLLATTPRVYACLQREIDHGIASGKISSPMTGVEGKALPYLQAFINESMRFMPPVMMLFPRVVPLPGDFLNNKFVPGGTEIAFDSWSFCRRTDVYGHDVDVFRPERFLEATPERKEVMERSTELLFGSGRYTCIGKNLAYLELNKVFVELLREFDFQAVTPEKPWEIKHSALFLLRNAMLKITERAK